MKLLALDSSGLVATVAIVSEEGLLAEYTVNYKKTHSQTLLPMLDEISKMVDLDLEEVDGIAIASGPGSFTGLRIGAATAKGIGLALNIPIVPVPSLEGLAYNIYGTNKLICPMMDARRMEVYTGLYEFKEQCFKIVSQEKAIAVEDIIDEINQIGRQVIFLGDGTAVYKDIIKDKIKVPYEFAPVHLNRQRAGAVAALGLQYFKEGRQESADIFAPEYLRVSQAERVRNETLNKKKDKKTL